MPAAKIDAEPRKTPRQSRSRVTVDAILTAAAQVLAERGHDGATTARIAERAGVSIGSFYQYYPNKEALIAALIERHADDLVERMKAALDNASGLEEAILGLLRAGIGAHRVNPSLHRILNEQTPRVGRMAKAMDAHGRIAGLIEAWLRRRPDQIAPGRDPAVASGVIETVLEGLVHRAVAASLPAQDVLEREGLALTLAYLRSPAAP